MNSGNRLAQSSLGGKLPAGQSKTAAARQEARTAQGQTDALRAAAHLTRTPALLDRSVLLEWGRYEATGRRCHDDYLNERTFCFTCGRFIPATGSVTECKGACRLRRTRWLREKRWAS